MAATTATHLAIGAPGGAVIGIAFRFTVTAEDQFNNTAASYAGSAVFTSTDSGAKLPAGTHLASGIGTFSATLQTAGTQTLHANNALTSSVTGASATLAVTCPASHFMVTGPSAATAGISFVYTVTALDAFNSTVGAYSGFVHFTSSDGLAVLPGNSVLTNGIGTFSVTLKTAADQALLTVSDNNTSGITGTISGTSGPIIVSAGTATHFVLSFPSATTAGSSFAGTVIAEDQFNNTAVSYGGTVAFTSSDVGASTSLPTSGLLISGVGTFTASLTTSGGQTLTASDNNSSGFTGSITGTSGSITVSALGATHFTVIAQANAVAQFAIHFTVIADDQFGNIAIGYAGIVDFFSSDSAAALPPNSTLTGGIGVFSATLVVVGNQAVTVIDTQTSSITGTSNTIVVSSTPSSHFLINAGPTNVTAGNTVFLTVTALDQFNAVTTGYAGTVVFSSTDHGASTSNEQYPCQRYRCLFCDLDNCGESNINGH